ncbi:MAG: right-handed parallel beta-helix repeat-containing protein [Acidimicrobiales bacterium]
MSRVVARTMANTAADIRLTVYNPGLASQGLTPVYEGSYMFSSGIGNLSLALPGLSPAEVVLTAAEAYFSTSFLPSGLSRPGGPSFLVVPYAQASAVGAVDPGAMLEAVLADPGMWLAELKGGTVAKLSPRVERTATGTAAEMYKVVIDLDEAASVATGPARDALEWLSRFYGVERVPAEVWVGRHGDLRQVRIWRLPRGDEPPATGTRKGWTFPGAGISEPAVTYVLGLDGFSDRMASSPSVSGVVRRLGTLGRGRCQLAGSTGLTTKMVARSGERITGAIDASGCSVGIYVPPGVTGVVVDRATVSGASDHAVFVEDAMHVVIENSTVSLSPGASSILDHVLIPEDKAIALVGASYSTVRDNLVTGRVDGGIAINDDGIIDPGAFNPGPPHGAVGDLIIGNRIINGSGGCGIVLSAFDPGEGVSDMTVTGNSVVNSHPGGIVLAANAPGTSASDNLVEKNTITGSLIPGIVLHSNAPNDTIQNNTISENIISADGADPIQGLDYKAGIALIGDFSAITDTLITGNIIFQESVGIWEANASSVHTGGNTIRLGRGAVNVLAVAQPNHVSELSGFAGH